MRSIDKAVRMHDAWLEARLAEENARQPHLRGELPSDLERWHDRLLELQVAESHMRQAFAEVLKEEQDHYGVGPSIKTGKIHGGLLDGTRTTWSPVIQEEDKLVFQAPRPGKKAVYLEWRPDPNTAARTMDDGSAIISFEALRTCVGLGSPAFLASALDHEGQHYQDLLEAGGWAGRATAEAHAYSREETTNDAIGLEDSEKEFVSGQAAAYRQAALVQSLAGMESGKPYQALPGSHDDPYHWKADEYYGDWMKQQAALNEIRRQRGELQRRYDARKRGALTSSRIEGDGRYRPGRSDGCSSSGWQSGGVGVPPLPCPRLILPPAATGTSATSAHADPAPIPAYAEAAPDKAPPATVPTSPPPTPSNSSIAQWQAFAGLACIDPSAVTQGQLDRAWPNVNGMADAPSTADRLQMGGCTRILFIRLMTLAAQGRTARLTWEQLSELARLSRAEANPPLLDYPRRATPPAPGDPCAEHGSFNGIGTGCIRNR